MNCPFPSLPTVTQECRSGGAKAGANVHSYEAMPGDVRPALPQVNGMLGDMKLRQATGWT